MFVALLVGLVSFVLMEPATYAAHRWIMHGIGWGLHRSHHRRRLGRAWTERWEANDAFPVMFAGVTILAMAAGTGDPSLRLLVPAGVGVTAYGAAYAFVHDVYIHGRIGHLPVLRPLEALRRAHALHHRYGREPYGMLVPIVPAALRARPAVAATEIVVSPRVPAA